MLELSISVVISCRNLHQYLPDCVESLNAQTMRATEIIIVHDNCTPPPVFPNTTTVVRDTHRGVADTRNEGARLATSETLLFVDADDALEEHFIEAMIKVKEKTKAQIIYPNVLLWSYWHKEVKLKNAWYESANKITLKNMLKFNQIVVSSLIDRDLFFKVGGMPNLPILEDYSMWLKCIKVGAKFAKSPHSVLKYRQRQEGRNRRDNDLKNKFYYQIKSEYENL